MEAMLKMMGAALGLLVPGLLIWLFSQGVKKMQATNEKKQKLIRMIVLVISLWTLAIWILALSDVLEYRVGDTIPRFLFALVIPVAVGIGLLINKDFKTMLDATPLSFIVGVQTFRLAGFAFLIIAGIGILPQAFTSAGYGDILTGAL